MLFAGNFAPRGFAKCEGQLLAVTENQSLFSIIGTTHGGDGRSTFALPDLRGQAPIHEGKGPGLSAHKLGDRAGVESVSLSLGEIPEHGHALQARLNPGKGVDATNHYLAKNDIKPYLDGPPDTTMGEDAIGRVGGGGAHENRGPRLTLNDCIALVGICPTRL